jgi:hypothetical protein
MLVKSWVNKFGDGYVQVTHAEEQIGITRYAGNREYFSRPFASDINVVMGAMDADIATLRKLTGATVVAHRYDCDRTHTNFDYSCNINLHPDVIKRREYAEQVKATGRLIRGEVAAR